MYIYIYMYYLYISRCVYIHIFIYLYLYLYLYFCLYLYLHVGSITLIFVGACNAPMLERFCALARQDHVIVKSTNWFDWAI